MNIAVIGGGASGMIAAISASDAGASVTIFEHMPRMGRKILLTGSGKCNISNVDMAPSHFHGGDTQLVGHIIEKCPQQETLGFFKKLGLYTRQRKGYMYPYCEQASAVVDVLRFAIRDRNIDVLTDINIKSIEKQKQSNDRTLEDRFVISTSSGKYCFDRVIMCCGSSANRNTGSDGSGYKLAGSLGHSIVKPLPALTYLVCEEEFYPSIAGIRTPAEISLYERNRKESYTFLGSEAGELQLTKNGISGVAVFNLSYMAIRALDEGKGVKAVIDLLPDIDKDELFDHMKNRIEDIADRSLEELFIGLLAKPLGILICKRCVLDLKKRCADLSDDSIRDLCDMLKSFDTIVKGSGNMDNAQVAQGGVAMSEVRDTLESRITSGLFFAGEILDVNGDCGGYNLQWAASSGIVAGREAAR